MSTTFNRITTDYRGATGGIAFDDSFQYYNKPSLAITKIRVWHTNFAYKLQIVLSDGTINTHGDDGGNPTNTLIELATDEFVTRIDGHTDNYIIYGLTFVTNKRTCRPSGYQYGYPGSVTAFQWGTADGAKPLRLLSFSGSCAPHLQGLQALFTEDCTVQLPPIRIESLPAPEIPVPIAEVHTEELPPIQNESLPVPEIPAPIAEDGTEELPPIRYESLSAQEIPVSINISLPTDVSKCFSNFTYQLMRPIITLYVGADKVRLHAYKDTLGQLPFFNAGLGANFTESTERIIEMPEDDPIGVSALIEFMYTGNYTCLYDTTSAKFHEGSTVPIGTLVNGVFHVDIHTIATKYDCSGLAAIAARNIKLVATELDSLNALRLWQAAYSTGLRLPGKRQDFGAYYGGRGLDAWVKCLFAEHSGDMEELMKACPALCFDLFRISMSEE